MYTEATQTPIFWLGNEQGNHLYIKREDLYPFSFGGNKARKAEAFFQDIDNGSYDCVVTYGSSSSNHSRIVSNMAAARDQNCYIISPEDNYKETYNSKLMELFGAEIIACPVQKVKETIDITLQTLVKNGHNPYFIAGGGHGNIGTQAFMDCYEEILRYEREENIHFDYIFHASGTGTTQAGLVCGQLMHRDERKIIGISIARKNPYGREVILDSIHSFFAEKKNKFSHEEIENATIFLDQYILGGYGVHSKDIADTINDVMRSYGIPLDRTYTGKAFWGMRQYLEKQNIINKNILFIHTGGTPLFFDYLFEDRR